MNKKALSGVVATSLIIVVAVISTIGFQGWFSDYSSQTFVNSEKQLESNLVKFKGITSNSLYLFSKSEKNITSLKIQDKAGNLVCLYNNILMFNESNLIVYHKFENDLNDSSENNYNNISITGSVFFKTGIEGNSLFSDNYSRIVINNVSKLNGSFNNYTMSVWIKAHNLYDPMWESYFGVYSSSGVMNDGKNYSQLDFDNVDGFRCRIDSLIHRNRVCPVLSNVSDFKWHFISLKVNGLNSTFRVDNEVENQTLISDVILFDPYVSYSNNLRFFGAIDEARIFNYSLSEEEISNLKFFNKVKLNLNENLTKINIFGCNLNKGEKYNLFMVGGDFKLEEDFVAK